MKLGRNNPCRSKLAIHSLSRTSVFLPGTARMCCGLTSSSVRASSSRTLKSTGRQYTPVDSSATCVTPKPFSQSPSANRSAVIVLNVRTCRSTWPSSSVIRTGHDAVLVNVEATTPRMDDLHRCSSLSVEVATAEREENTTFPRVLVSNETATLIITGRAPRQLPLRALGTNEKHPFAAATAPAYSKSFMPIPVREDMTLPLLPKTQVRQRADQVGADVDPLLAQCPPALLQVVQDQGRLGPVHVARPQPKHLRDPPARLPEGLEQQPVQGRLGGIDD